MKAIRSYMLFNKIFLRTGVFVFLFFIVNTTIAQIELGTNFRVLSPNPVDSRMVVLDTNTRNAIVWRYEGLIVYVKDQNKNYQLVGGTSNSDWTELLSNSYAAGTGLTLTGSTFYAQVDSALWNAKKLQGLAIASTAPTNGQVLTWNNTASQWEPASDNNTTYSAGTGINLSGTTFSIDMAEGTGISISGNTINADSDSAFWNARQLQSRNISNTTPTNGQVLTWNNASSLWEAQNPTGTTYTAGQGLELSGNTFIADLGSGLQFDGADQIAINLSAGTGIIVSGATVSADNTSDLWNANRLKGRTLSGSAPTDGQVIAWNNTLSQWQPTNDCNTTYGAGQGIELIGNNFSADLGAGLQFDGADQITLNLSSGTGITISGSTISANASDDIWDARYLRGNTISSTAPSNGQVLKWNTFLSVWEPAADNNSSYTGGQGVLISGNSIGADLGTGLQFDGSDKIAINLSSGTGITISGSTVNANTTTALWNADQLQGSSISAIAPSSAGQVLKWNGSEWGPGTDSSVTYYAGDGLYKNGTSFHTYYDSALWNANQLQSRDVANTVPTDGQVLAWNNAASQWEPATDNNTTYNAGTGLDLSGTTFSIDLTGGTGVTISGSTINADATTAMWNADQLQSRDLANTAPTDGQVLAWNNAASQWEPATDNNSTYTNGQGIVLSGNTFSADLGNGLQFDGSDKIAINLTGGTGVTISGSTINADAATAMWNADQLQSRDLANTAPTDGQVLAWNNAASQWEPATDNNTTYNAGTGLDLSGTTFSIDLTGGTGVTISGSTINADATTAMWNADQLQSRDLANTAPTDGQVLAWNNAASQWEPATDNNTTYNAGTGLDLSGTTFSIDLTGGTGVTISGSTINADATTAMWNADQLQSRDLANTAPTDGQVLAWNNAASQWEPATDDNTTYTNGQGIVLSGNTFSADLGNGLQFDGSDKIAINLTGGTGVTISGSTINADATTAMWNADQLQSRDLANTAPTDGQVLAWNNAASQWEPATDNNTTYSNGQGIVLSGNTFSADLGNGLQFDGSDKIAINLTGGTGVTISGSTINADADTAMWNADQLQSRDLANTAPTDGQVLAWNNAASQWEPATDNNTTYSAGIGIIMSGTTIYAANSQNLWNANKIQGNNLATTAPTINGQALVWNSTSSHWEPGNVSGVIYTGGTGITVTGSVISANTSDAIWNAEKIQGKGISTSAPSSGQILKYNGTQWAPGTDNNTTYQSGDGIALSGTTIKARLGDGLQFDGLGQISIDLTAGTGITVSGSSISANNTTNLWNANQIQSRSVSSSAPGSGQVLKWNGAQWTPQDDDNSSYSAGTGIVLIGNAIYALVDNNLWNAAKIQGKSISSTTPSTNHILKYNGSTWALSNDENTTYDDGNGISFSGTTINAKLGIGLEFDVLNQITLDLTAGAGITVSGGTITARNTTALWNASQLQGSNISSAPPSTPGQILKWDGSEWAIDTDNNTTYQAGDGISISGTTITGKIGQGIKFDALNQIAINLTGGTGISISGSTINADSSSAIWNANKIQSNDIAATAPNNGQVLAWNDINSRWEPTNDNNTTYSAGIGITLSGTSINADASTAMWNSNKLQSRNVSNTAPSSGQVLAWNDVDTRWEPADDANTTYTSGFGINISGSTISVDDAIAANYFPYSNGSKFLASNIYFDGTNIGIGTTSPNYKLEVNGQIKTNILTETSDARFKEDITSIPDALEKILHLRGVNYRWKEQYAIDHNLEHNKRVGLIAQEVEKILPEVVINDNKGYKSLSYTSIVGVLVEAVKEQQKIINEQGRRLEELNQNYEELLHIMEINNKEK